MNPQIWVVQRGHDRGLLPYDSTVEARKVGIHKVADPLNELHHFC